MKHLATINGTDVGAPSMASKMVRQRRAARAVMINDKGGVYLVHMKARAYYKLPGGGINEGEGIETALHRELLEECGTDGEVIATVGKIEEFREYDGLHQISYCFLVRQKGGHILPSYMVDEADDGAELIIAQTLDDAIKLVEDCVAADNECRFMLRRDAILLNEAKQLVSQ